MICNISLIEQVRTAGSADEQMSEVQARCSQMLASLRMHVRGLAADRGMDQI